MEDDMSTTAIVPALNAEVASTTITFKAELGTGKTYNRATYDKIKNLFSTARAYGNGIWKMPYCS